MKISRVLLNVVFGILFVALSFPCFAQLTQLTAESRTYPFGASVEARYNEHFSLWDARAEGNPHKFGYWQLSGAVAAHGKFEIGVLVAPISFVKVEIAHSVTSRFYDSLVLDCTQYVCRGQLTRDSVKVSVPFLLGGLIWVPQLESIVFSASDPTKPFVDENENILGGSNHDRLSINRLAVLKQVDDYKFGLMLKTATMTNSEQWNQGEYFIANGLYRDWDITLGLGAYKSSVTSLGPNAFVSAKYQWGTAP